MQNTYGSTWIVEWVPTDISIVSFCANFAGSDFDKRQGCEGAIMSLRCETIDPMALDQKSFNSHIVNNCVTYCRLKVFKFKGGNRKLKQDYEKFNKRDQEIKVEINKYWNSYKQIEECSKALKDLQEQER
ncbi:hypothetical protein RF11_12753 [Thelohanellus kitauei]|uniref:Grh/CP2 DB domain-containing protein n=1 Tax=Thelohanellus kitauei TaxID=669202 RepID=A0A0C2MAI9_THEKT|nr:hypothetical protein RF11_12753 [Thelohanellus kitauei]